MGRIPSGGMVTGYHHIKKLAFIISPRFHHRIETVP